MQLKKLTLQAFGPFKDKVIIDFEKDKIDPFFIVIYVYIHTVENKTECIKVCVHVCVCQ